MYISLFFIYFDIFCLPFLPHRELSTSISIPAGLLAKNVDFAETSCLLLFTETIPSGAYVDPYQVASLRPFGGPDVSPIICFRLYEPRREKTGLRDFRPGPTQTGLYKLRSRLEA